MTPPLLVAGAVVAALVGVTVLSRRTGVAAPLLLVVVGVGASLLPGAPTLEVEPELVLAGVLPLLLYASAVTVPVTDLRRNLPLITLLSVGLVVLTALAVGAVVHLVLPTVPLWLAVALGAVVSPTDAVAATAVGRRLGLPGRLMVVLEGESLVNDASALVVLRTALGVGAASVGLDLRSTVGGFVWAVVAAVGIGLLVGWGTVRLRERLADPVLSTTTSFAVPFLAFLPAELLDASGVLAVVVAGLVTGTLGAHRLGPDDRTTQATVWQTVAFVLEGAVFLAMGYQLPRLVEAAGRESSGGRVAGLVLVVLVVLVGLRFAVLAWPAALAAVGPRDRGERRRRRLDVAQSRLDDHRPTDDRQRRRLRWARRRLDQDRADVAFEESEPLTVAGSAVLAWAGMRGVITVAAAQTIPQGVPYRSTVVLVASVVAVVTLALFGLTLPSLVRRVHLSAGSRGSGGSADRTGDAARELVDRVRQRAMDDVGPADAQTLEGEPLPPDQLARLREAFPPDLLLRGAEEQHRAAGTPASVGAVQRRYLGALRHALAVERSIGAHGAAAYRLVEHELDGVERRVDLAEAGPRGD